MDTTTALTLELGSLHQPVVTTYQLGTLLFRLYQTKTYQGKPLTQLKKDFPEPLDLKRMTDQLLENGVLQPHKDFAGGVFVILGKEPTASEVACGVDPFAYLSHLSAMEHHGLTNRMPKMLFLSSPPPTEWRQSALARMKRDLGETPLEVYNTAGLPALTKPRFDKLHRQAVNVYTSLHLGAFVAVRDRALRVATLGRTFLDMLKEPDLCGGIYHVLDVYS